MRRRLISWDQVIARALSYRQPWERLTQAQAMRESNHRKQALTFAREPGESLRRAYPRIRRGQGQLVIDLPEVAAASAEIR